MRTADLTFAFSTALLVFVCLPACMTGSDASLGQGESVQRVSTEPDEPPDTPPPCVNLPDCSFEFLGGSGGPLADQLQCTQQYKWLNGAHNGTTGGIGEFCPATASTLTRLRNGWARGFLAGFYDARRRICTDGLSDADTLF